MTKRITIKRQIHPRIKNYTQNRNRSINSIDKLTRMCNMCHVMNITLSSDEKTIQKTREFARRQGTSLNELLRRYMDSVTGTDDKESVLEEFSRNALAHGGQSAPDFRFDRDEAHRR